eukprot:856325-Alexandrium_andersonii.AAC.1
MKARIAEKGEESIVLYRARLEENIRKVKRGPIEDWAAGIGKAMKEAATDTILTTAPRPKN